MAIINYVDPKSHWLSFKGVGLFIDGRLHNTSFACLSGNGEGIFFSKLENGRPADKFYIS
jgi:hypothetical protein